MIVSCDLAIEPEQHEEMFLDYLVSPGGSVSGSITVPGDKSISHRSIMLGAIAEGVTQVSGFLEGDDALATLNAFRSMGVTISDPQDGNVTINGVGLWGLKAPNNALDMGNSGTSMRLLSGLLAGQRFASELRGDASLHKRPMGRVITPLLEMGADIHSKSNGKPPLFITPTDSLNGICYQMPMASAQVKSCLLLAGLYADGDTVITEPAATRDHTERMLRGFSYPVDSNNGTVTLKPGGELIATDIQVPADISSATFFMVAAAITPGSCLRLQSVGINPTRTGAIEILRLMGANICLENVREVGGEPIADILVEGTESLKGIDIPESLVPLAIDEFPALFIAAACAEGQTRLSGAEELRVKESDRILVMAEGLHALGIDAEVQLDGIVIQGGLMGGGEIETHMDHRIAMSFAIAGLRAKETIHIRNCEHVATSFPDFAALANRVGLRIDYE